MVRFFILLLFFVNTQFSQEYYVCGNSDKYHLDLNCQGLKNCKRGITKVNANQILGKTICGYEKYTNNEKSNINYQFSDASLYDKENPGVIICGNSSKYHFNKNCEGLKNCKSNTQVVKLEEVMYTKDLCQFESNNASTITYNKEPNNNINLNYLFYALGGTAVLICIILFFKKLNENNFKKFEKIIDEVATNDFSSLIVNLSQNNIKHKELENDNHYHFMIENINKAKNEIVISSGWVTKSVVNKGFINLFEKKLKDGVKILIVYGYRYKGKHNNSSLESIHELEILSKKYSNFQIKKGSNTKGNHSKCLIIDKKYIAVTSYNWLSTGINVKNREKGVVIFDEKFAEKERNFFYSI